MTVVHLSNYFEIVSYQSVISLTKVSFSRTQTMLYLCLCNRNGILKILNRCIFHSLIIMSPAALTQLQLSLFPKGGEQSSKEGQGGKEAGMERKAATCHPTGGDGGQTAPVDRQPCWAGLEEESREG